MLRPGANWKGLLVLGLEISEGQREMGWREKDWIDRDRERESAQAERQKNKLREKGSWWGAGWWCVCWGHRAAPSGSVSLLHLPTLSSNLPPRKWGAGTGSAARNWAPSRGGEAGGGARYASGRGQGSWPRAGVPQGGAGVRPACSYTSQRGEFLTPGRPSFSQSANTDQVTHSGPGLGWAERAGRLVPAPGREQSRQRETWKPLGPTLQIPILELLVLVTNQNKMLVIQILMKLPFFPQFCESCPPLLSQHTAPSQQPSKHRLASG